MTDLTSVTSHPPAADVLGADVTQPAPAAPRPTAAGALLFVSLAPRRGRARQPWNLSRTVNRLRLAAGGWVSTAELIEAIWGERPDGGPDYAASACAIQIHRLRERGFPIVGSQTRGYRYAT